MALLQLKNLEVSLKTKATRQIILDKVNLEIQEDEIFGLVGESGSGKTMTALAVLGLLPDGCVQTSGEIFWQGKNLSRLSQEEYRQIRGRQIGLIFQDPWAAFNPVIQVGLQVSEVLEIHEGISRAAALKKVTEIFQEVNLAEPEKIILRFPHELSGGQLQRVAIASALISRPQLLIADEPTTALDVVTQFQILELLKKIQKEHRISLLFISHDLSLIKFLCEKVAVMRQGVILETGQVTEIFEKPKQNYTKNLISSIPVLRRI